TRRGPRLAPADQPGTVDQPGPPLGGRAHRSARERPPTRGTPRVRAVRRTVHGRVRGDVLSAPDPAEHGVNGLRAYVRSPSHADARGTDTDRRLVRPGGVTANRAPPDPAVPVGPSRVRLQRFDL